jgi:hypothetical protein
MQVIGRIMAAAVAALVMAGHPVHAAQSCDRECLTGVADAYLAAIAAHDPGKAPLAGNIRFVENTQRLKPGEGIWADAAGKATSFRIVVPDIVQGSIGVMTLIDRKTAAGTVPAQLAVRLKIEDRKITEAEHLVADVPANADRARMKAPRAALVAVVPGRERLSRTELAKIAGSYYDAIDESDGKLAPFAADCEREENMLVTAGPNLPPAAPESVDVNGRSPPPLARDCIGQMSSRRFAYVDTIDHRRIVAVDPVQGLAMGFSHFRQSMKLGPQRLIAADGSELMWEEKRDPYDLPAAHIFKITGGKIHEVEALGVFIPYNSPTGWE